MYTLSPERIETLNNIFTYHAPKDNQPARYEELRSLGKMLATRISVLTPMSREQSIAITKVQEAIMFANAAIAINE